MTNNDKYYSYWMYEEDNYISHVGVGHDDNPPGRGSGRFAYGSGENPGQHQFTFLSEVKRLRSNGLTDGDIAKILLGENANTTNLRAEISIQRTEKRKFDRAKAIEMLEKTNGNVSEAARRLGYKNESSLRSMLNEVSAENADKYQRTAEVLKAAIKKAGKPIDVSTNSGLHIGVNDHTLKIAVSILEQEGYVKTKVGIPTSGDNKTTITVLSEPGTIKSDIQKNKFDIAPIVEFTPDNGKTWWTPEFPESIDSNRVVVRYAEEGGKEKDGVIEIRKNVKDLSLGKANYAQVRIAVDGTHYMKGMAIYADDKDLPDGVDIIINTNKKKGIPMIGKKDHEVLKRLKTDPKTGEVDRENPFGALIKGEKEVDGKVKPGGQYYYLDDDGKTKLSPINKLREEGDWDSWSRNLASQFLSKQPIKLINQQIRITTAEKKAELEAILNLTNPVIKKKLLEEFAKNCDSKASELSVKGFKNQAFQVLLPVSSLKDNEVYAPNYDNGDQLALVRYPHGGIFEIPILTVNNNNKKAESIMGKARDAVGINANVAEILSGADFDGDTALTIPVKSNGIKIQNRKPLDDLVGWDAKNLYKLPDDAKAISHDRMQTEMGIVTNLITDMTVSGADFDDISKAVKHSMVVVDSEKHRLDYKKSYKDHDIIELKKKYQGVNEKTGNAKGASTIFSRAGSEIYVDKFKEVNDVKKMTPEEVKRYEEGKKVWHKTGETMLKQIKDPKKMTPEELEIYKAGKKVYRQTDDPKQKKVHQMDVVDDAVELVRDKTNEKEMAYAHYANDLKELANQARKVARSLKARPVNTSAKVVYKKEVDSLNDKLKRAQMNQARERQAVAIMNAEVSIKFKENPDLDYEHRQRERALALDRARAQVGAKKDPIDITDKEWEAIQAGAISTNRLEQIYNNTNKEAFKRRATPRENRGVTPAQRSLIQALYASGMYTQKELADRFGLTASMVSSIVRE